MPVSETRIERLKILATSASTDGVMNAADEKEYSEIRRELMSAPELQGKVPKFILVCSNLKEVRSDMQALFGKYADRRNHIRHELATLLSPFAVEAQKDLFQEVVTSTDLSKLVTLPQDIQQKGKEGAECYVYLFCIENSIREFIVQVNAITTVIIPRQVQEKIDKRKQTEATRKYLPVRGSSDVYYCDFIELADIIRANWKVFTKYFPGKDEHWFTNMLQELYAVRLLVGHNSAVGKDELQKLDVFYKVILSYLKIE